MKTWLLCGVATIAAWAFCGGAAEAQTNYNRKIFEDNTIRRPTVSPYLNLLAPAGNGLPAYQSFVRPLMQQREAAIQQGAAIQQLQQRLGAGLGSGETVGASQGIRSTGHQTRFMHYSHYYLSPNGR